jgi:hypothetical protein
MRRGWWILKIAVFGLLAVTLFGLVTQALWNWLVPVLFNGPMISIWQAFGLLILSKILFSGFSGRKSHGGWGHRGGQWKPYWKARYDRMSPEERERLKERMKAKWCDWETETSEKAPGTEPSAASKA